MRRTRARLEKRARQPAATRGRAAPDPARSSPPGSAPKTARERILDGAFVVLRRHGYAATNTRAIAAQAGVSKRELYREFGNKDGILGALIAERAARMRRPFAAAEIGSREFLAATLRQVGAALLQQLCSAPVLSVFRLAISAAEGSPAMARVLDENARGPNRRALVALLARARRRRLVIGDPARLAAQFVALTAGDIHLALLLGLRAPPTARELERHAAATTEAFLRLAQAP
jgi:AcrR family transcriptional regulator